MALWKKNVALLIVVILIVLGALERKNIYKIFRKEKVKSSIPMDHSSVTEIKNIGRPISITKDKDGNFYTCDFSGHNVKILDSNFSLIKQIGKDVKGSNPGEFNVPHAVDFDAAGNFYVTDYANKRIQKFSPSGEFLSIINFERALAGPATAYFDKNYNLYISDFDSNSLIKSTKDGKLLGWIGAKIDGTLTDGWELSGSPAQSAEPGGFYKLHSAKFSDDGIMYVIDSHNNRVQRFSEDGKFMGWIGAKEDGLLTNGWEMTGKAISTDVPGGFNIPVAMDFINGEEIAILEYGNPRIQKFSKDGKFLGWYGGTQDSKVTDGWQITGLPREGTDVGAFKNAYDLKVYGNKVYVADTGNYRLQIIDFHP
ncbi:TPA: hypothetical protein DD449_03780 [Candidatus Berkelbacteria bacterium]|uniref:NHL repeat containing protein n=1 Tax=Berkelbacteria bacterium GW2011_GWE1_39_12 TaxID=1618337 RepID=A0A0G4B431_9BACT|nr:MAG: NHL repeat containing protein [Berkelbacteria bacterium GW2011_GWE1_39_12]HBO60776.1 hypothetical protein [Candidatus Berkelbacteria bacterium]